MAGPNNRRGASASAKPSTSTNYWCSGKLLDKNGNEVRRDKSENTDSSTEASVGVATLPPPTSSTGSSSTVQIRRNRGCHYDLVIHAKGIVRNATEISTSHFPNGKSHYTRKNLSTPRYNFFDEFSRMTPSRKAAFFEYNHISIQVSLKAPEQEREEIEERKKLGAAYVKFRDVVDVLGYLGDSFAAGAKKITVELCLPKDPDAPTGLVNKEYLEIDYFEPSWKGMKLDVDPFSPKIVLLDRLSEFLNKFKSIEHLTVLLRNPRGVQGQFPVQLKQLAMAFPFHVLNFKGWKLKYLPYTLPDVIAPFRVYGWALRRCNWAQSRFARAKKDLIEDNARKAREYRYNNPRKIPNAIRKE